MTPIEHYEAALMAAFPEGASGKVFEHWNAARIAQAAPNALDGWREAAVAWEVCASVHREYARWKDPFFNTRQGDFVKHAQDARVMLAAAMKPEGE